MVGGPNATGLVKNDAVSVVTEDIVVCGTCGSGSHSQIIVKCTRCNDYEHCYCMKVVTFEIPDEWYCAKCEEYANGGPKPSQDGDTGCKSEMGSLNENKGVMLTVGSILEYSRRPAPAICWR